MRSLLFPTALLVCGLASCDKVKSLVAKAGGHEKTPAAASAPASTAAPHSGPLVTDLHETTYEAFISQPGRVIMVDYYATWCGPCRMLSPVLDEIAAENMGRVLVGRVNVDSNPELSSRAGVSSIPDVRIFVDGKRVDQFIGFPGAAKIRKQLEPHLNRLPPLPANTGDPAKSSPADPSIQPMSKDWMPPGMQSR